MHTNRNDTPTPIFTSRVIAIFMPLPCGFQSRDRKGAGGSSAPLRSRL